MSDELPSNAPVSTSSAAAPRESVALNAALPPVDEVEVWWGSYSSRTLWPSWIGCLLVAGLIFWCSWFWQVRGLTRLCLLGSACLLCIWQLVRWTNRVFGYNYRLTTRQLLYEPCLLARKILRVPLESIARVAVEQTGVERSVGVGRVVLFFKDERQTPLVLHGVRQPERVADTFRDAIKRACRTSGV